MNNEEYEHVFLLEEISRIEYLPTDLVKVEFHKVLPKLYMAFSSQVENPALHVECSLEYTVPASILTPLCYDDDYMH